MNNLLSAPPPPPSLLLPPTTTTRSPARPAPNSNEPQFGSPRRMLVLSDDDDDGDDIDDDERDDHGNPLLDEASMNFDCPRWCDFIDLQLEEEEARAFGHHGGHRAMAVDHDDPWFHCEHPEHEYIDDGYHAPNLLLNGAAAEDANDSSFYGRYAEEFEREMGDRSMGERGMDDRSMIMEDGDERHAVAIPTADSRKPLRLMDGAQRLPRSPQRAQRHPSHSSTTPSTTTTHRQPPQTGRPRLMYDVMRGITRRNARDQDAHFLAENNAPRDGVHRTRVEASGACRVGEPGAMVIDAKLLKKKNVTKDDLSKILEQHNANAKAQRRARAASSNMVARGVSAMRPSSTAHATSVSAMRPSSTAHGTSFSASRPSSTTHAPVPTTSAAVDQQADELLRMLEEHNARLKAQRVANEQGHAHRKRGRGAR